MIKYRLIEDPKNPGKKKAEIIHSDLIELDDIIAELPGGFAMKDEYKKIIYDFFETAFNVAQKEGQSVSTPLIKIEPTGNMDENGDFEVTIQPGDELEAAMSQVKMVRVDENVEPDPVKISFVHDLLSNTTNKFLTRGGIVEINGKYLKLRPYTGADESECLMFQTSKTKIKIKIDNILTNSVHKIVAELPENLPDEEGYFIIITGMFDNPKKMRPMGKSKKLKVI